MEISHKRALIASLTLIISWGLLIYMFFGFEFNSFFNEKFKPDPVFLLLIILPIFYRAARISYFNAIITLLSLLTVVCLVKLIFYIVGFEFK